MRAFCLIRHQPVYRHDAFQRGLAAAGFEVLGAHHVPKVESPQDVLVIWNRYGAVHEIASRFEKEGGRIVVAENAYVALDRSNRQRYALARDGHNGSGWWAIGDDDRWESLGVPILPWRTEGEHILICPNRSFGRPDFIMPPSWAETTAAKLRKITKREVRIRPHPGNDAPRKPLSEDLKNAWAVVIWSSSAGVDALLAGIPVFCTAPYWVAWGASSSSDLSLVETPPLPDRLSAMQRLAWAQWSVKEIESGEPFQHLLHWAPSFAGRV